MKNIIFTICCILTLNCYSKNNKLTFNEGTFRILQLTDLHWVSHKNYNNQNDSTLQLIKHLISREKPQLVVLTGDIVVASPAKEGWNKLNNLFTEMQIPYLITFGNHDTESDIKKENVIKMLEKEPYFLNKTNEAKNVTGEGNGTYPVYGADKKTRKWILYGFDTHAYPQIKDAGSYEWIKFDQISWYRSESEKYAKGIERGIPSLAFIHIPLPEYTCMNENIKEIGNKKEPVCAPIINSGLFSNFIEKGDVLGVFAGHDHNNDFLLDMNGRIALAYGRKSGYPSAYQEVLERGGRMIILKENKRSFDTYIVDLNGQSYNYTFTQKAN